jgi:hypothetical protein
MCLTRLFLNHAASLLTYITSRYQPCQPDARGLAYILRSVKTAVFVVFFLHIFRDRSAFRLSIHEPHGLIHDGGKALGLTMFATSNRWEL